MTTTNHIRTVFFLSAIMAIFTFAGYLIAGQTGMVIAFFIALAMNFMSYWNSDKFVLKMYNAREANSSSYPEYYNIVTNLAAKANLPQPKIYVIDSEQPNAFATGRNPENAAVVASTGLLKRLTAEEISGVMAHELAHVENRDILTMSICATFASALSMLANFGFMFGHQHRSNDGERHQGSFIGPLIAMLLAPLLATLIQMALSRTREYSADARGGELCGNPLWLASALQKIASGVEHNTDAKQQYNQATAHMFIINPLKGRGGDNLFTTHPATQNRIAALVNQAEKMGITNQNSDLNKPTASKPKWMRFK